MGINRDTDVMFSTCLLGPLYEDVVDRMRESIKQGLVDRLWEEFPVIHLDTRSPEVVEQLRQRFGNAVFTTTGEAFAGVLGDILRTRGLTLATAESCTGGLVGDMVTDVPGSSDYFLLGVVSYSNHAKQAVLGVDPKFLKQYGAVSEPVVRGMLTGVLQLSGADCGVAISGIAGPSGGSPEKPVGTVYIAAGCKGQAEVMRYQFPYDRRKNKVISAYTALDMLRRHLMAQKREDTDVVATQNTD